LEVMAPEHKTDHLHPSSVEAKKCGAIPPLQPTSSWRSAYSVKRKDSFTFTMAHIRVLNNPIIIPDT
jgi:hypothetical protein